MNKLRIISTNSVGIVSLIILMNWFSEKVFWWWRQSRKAGIQWVTLILFDSTIAVFMLMITSANLALLTHATKGTETIFSLKKTQHFFIGNNEFAHGSLCFLVESVVSTEVERPQPEMFMGVLKAYQLKVASFSQFLCLIYSLPEMNQMLLGIYKDYRTQI